MNAIEFSDMAEMSRIIHEYIDNKEKQMTIEQLEETLKACQEELRTLKEKQEKEIVPPHPRWQSKIGKTYYHAYRGDDLWYGLDQDQKAYAVGDVFKTRPEAEFAVERLKVLAEMREWAGDSNDPYHISYFPYYGEIMVTKWMSPRILYGNMRFATKEDAENCIEAVGAERIRKYYFEAADETDSE